MVQGWGAVQKLVGSNPGWGKLGGTSIGRNEALPPGEKMARIL